MNLSVVAEYTALLLLFHQPAMTTTTAGEVLVCYTISIIGNMVLTNVFGSGASTYGSFCGERLK